MLGRTNKTVDRLEKMLDSAISGEFQESDFDETQLSRLETKWKRFLGQSQMSLQNLEKEKENVKELVSDISHQTKTPLTNIKLYVSLLGENLVNQRNGAEDQMEQNLQLFQEIQKQTDKLEFLIQSLTKMSRLESNIVSVKPEMQKVSLLLRDAVGVVQPKAEKKDITFEISCSSQYCACFDFKWTREALENVLDNAVKYSDRKSKITVSVTEYEMYTAISVKDQGIGIAGEDIPRIFERFYRADQIQQEEGVGIGLYLTREILRKENGYVRVKSEKGKGTEFILYLWKRNERKG